MHQSYVTIRRSFYNKHALPMCVPCMCLDGADAARSGAFERT